MHFGPHEKRSLTVLMVREESPVAVRESSEREAWKESDVSAQRLQIALQLGPFGFDKC